MAIKFIENPPFEVDFRQFVKRDKVESTFQGVQSVVARPFQLIQYTFIAVGKSAYVTLQYSGTSFKHIVLGYYGSLKFRPPKDLYLTALKVTLWMAMTFWCFTTTALCLLINQMAPPSNGYLTLFAGKEIDIEHLQTKELAIDVSGVPKEVTVDTLMTMFEKINFNDENKLGYMPPSSRQEGKTIYTTDDLKKGLENFINRVNERVAFLGTPPAYDTPRLMAFYQQIENAIRFSIHKVDQNLQDFQQVNGADHTQYDENKLKIYKNLLEDKARIVIDMAIAGKHCGARYMGEAMTTYYNFESKTVEKGTLQDSLFELLAQKRVEIAQAHVQKYLGNDTHALSKYMGNLGQLLGLPGTSNVIETLDQNFDLNLYVQRFFAEYTVDAIIETVQAEIKKSNNFREKVIDWLKDQVGNWKKDARNAQEIMGQIQLIIDEKVEMKNVSPEFQNFQKLIVYLQEKKIKWPDNIQWDAFVTELFAFNEVKEWCKENLSHKTPIELAKEKNKLKQACSEAALGLEVTQQLRKAIEKGDQLSLGGVTEKNIEEKKIEKIRTILPIEKETLERIFRGQAVLLDVVMDYCDLMRRNEFLGKLKLKKIATEGVSSKILEWILVSQKILLPQEIK